VDYRTKEPAIDTTVFPGTPKEWFWSSSSYVGDPSIAWFVDFWGGLVHYYDYIDESDINIWDIDGGDADGGDVDGGDADGGDNSYNYGLKNDGNHVRCVRDGTR
jgi:hypothetical protein